MSKELDIQWNQYRTPPRVGVYDCVFNKECGLRRGQPYRETARARQLLKLHDVRIQQFAATVDEWRDLKNMLKMLPFYSAYTSAALAILGTLLIGKWLVRSAGTTFGWYLRRKTAARRQAILSQVRNEETDYQSQEKKSDDGDWEKLESHAVGSSPNGGQADDEWEGTIGFFHPFW